MGSSRSTSCLNPSAIPSMRSFVSIRRSTRLSFILFFLPLATSSSFAFRSTSAFSTRRCATAASASFFFAVERLLRLFSASLAFFPICISISFIVQSSCIFYIQDDSGSALRSLPDVLPRQSLRDQNRSISFSVTTISGEISVGSVGTSSNIWNSKAAATLFIPLCFSRKRS